MTPVLNTVLHPHDSTSVLNWMLAEWIEDPQQHLLLIVAKGDAESWDNRVRVRLSQIRSQLKKDKVPFKKFGFESFEFDWTEENGREYSALTIVRMTHVRHNFATILNGESFDIGKTNK